MLALPRAASFGRFARAAFGYLECGLGLADSQQPRSGSAPRSAVRQSLSHSLGDGDIPLAFVQQERIVQRSGRLVVAFCEFEGVRQSDEDARAGVQLVTLLGTINGTARELLCGRRFPSQRGQLRACAI